MSSGRDSSSSGRTAAIDGPAGRFEGEREERSPQESKKNRTAARIGTQQTKKND